MEQDQQLPPSKAPPPHCSLLPHSAQQGMAALPLSSCSLRYSGHPSPPPPPRSKRRPREDYHLLQHYSSFLLLQFACLLLLLFLDVTHASSRGQNDYYTRLGLKRGANKKEIARAYRRMAVKTHPGTSAFRRATHAPTVEHSTFPPSLPPSFLPFPSFLPSSPPRYR